MDLAVVAGVNLLGTLVLIIALKDAFTIIPDLIKGIFASEPFTYSFSYLFLIAIAFALYLALTPLAVAYYLFRADPVGRDLQAFILGLLVVATLAMNDVPGLYYLVLILTSACVAVLYLSPWCRQALSTSARASGVPGPVVMARFLGLFVFSLVALSVLVCLPGLRFIGDLGISFVVTLLCYAGALALAWPGLSALTRAPSRTGRIQVSAAAALVMVANIVTAVANSNPLFGTMPMLLTLGALVALLWGPPSVRSWFGDTAAGPAPAASPTSTPYGA